MVTLRSPWAQSWTKPNARKERLHGPELNHRVCLTSVSLLLRQLFKTTTTRHGGPDVSGIICWQQLAGKDRATAILSEVSTPTPHSVMYPETVIGHGIVGKDIPIMARLVKARRWSK